MYVYDRDGNYRGRAGRPIRDAHTGKVQRMSQGEPKRPGGCFAKSAVVMTLATSSAALLAAGLVDWI
jgi:hypothetical protein